MDYVKVFDDYKTDGTLHYLLFSNGKYALIALLTVRTWHGVTACMRAQLNVKSSQISSALIPNILKT